MSSNSELPFIRKTGLKFQRGLIGSPSQENRWQTAATAGREKASLWLRRLLQTQVGRLLSEVLGQELRESRKLINGGRFSLSLDLMLLSLRPVILLKCTEILCAVCVSNGNKFSRLSICPAFPALFRPKAKKKFQLPFKSSPCFRLYKTSLTRRRTGSLIIVTKYNIKWFSE